MPSKYGFGNTRKKSPYKMGKARYGMDQRNPIKKNGETKEIKGTSIFGHSIDGIKKGAMNIFDNTPVGRLARKAKRTLSTDTHNERLQKRLGVTRKGESLKLPGKEDSMKRMQKSGKLMKIGKTFKKAKRTLVNKMRVAPKKLDVPKSELKRPVIRRLK